MVPRRPGFIGKPGCVRSRASICLFSSTHSTTALSGGLRYNPTTSVSFSVNAGSVDNLKVLTRWSCTSCASQIRCTVDVADARRFGHRAATPVRRTRRRLLQRGIHDGLDGMLGDLRFPTPAGSHLATELTPSEEEPRSPAQYRRPADTECRRDARIGDARRRPSARLWRASRRDTARLHCAPTWSGSCGHRDSTAAGRQDGSYRAGVSLGTLIGSVF